MPNGRESWVSSCGHKGEEIKCPKNNHQHLMYNLSLSRWERRYLNHWRLPGACWMTLSIVRKQQMDRGSIKSPLLIFLWLFIVWNRLHPRYWKKRVFVMVLLLATPSCLFTEHQMQGTVSPHLSAHPLLIQATEPLNFVSIFLQITIQSVLHQLWSGKWLLSLFREHQNTTVFPRHQ